MSSDDDIDVTTVPNSDTVCSSPVASLGARSKSSDLKHSKSVFKKRSSKPLRKRHPHTCSDEWSIPETPSPYYLGSKKRQNGDKIGPVTMRSKRTCLGNRLLHPDWPNFKKKNGFFCHQSSYSDDGLKNRSPSHGNSSSATANSDDIDLQHRFMNHKKLYERHSRHHHHHRNLLDVDGPSSSVSSASGASNEKSCCSQPSEDCSLSLPSTSRSGQDCIDLEDDSSINSSRGVRFLDSESDNEGHRSLNTAPLKGGRPFPEYFQRVRKVLGKKVQKILYSDDSSDDSEWPTRHHRSVKCISSESEDSDISTIPRKKILSKHTIAQLSSSDSNDDIIPNTNTSASNDEIRNLRSAPSSSHLTPPVSSLLSQNRGNNPFLAFRNRFIRNKSSRRSLSPRRRSMGSSQRHSGIVRSNLRQLGNRELQHRHLVAQFPDLFDAEDSSEVEFFTAHSYSDTETSTESVSGVRPNCSNVGPTENLHNSNVVTASSDDEIRIIFDSNGDSVNRRGCSRRSGTRLRNSRGSRATRTVSEDIATVSPDPVAQVRQVEEDERFARLLQAEFDAEMNEAGTFVSMTDSDESAVVDPVSLDSPTVPFTPLPCASTTITYHHSPIVLNRSRNILQISGIGRRRGRRNIPTTHDPWMWQFARVLGLGPAHEHRHNHGRNDEESNGYEALIHLAESVGEVVPRGLLKTEINRLPTRRFIVPGSASTSQACDEVVHKRTALNKECQVCLFDYENGDLLRILPCFHEFHTPCIDPWLKINHTCPVCRVEVVLDS